MTTLTTAQLQAFDNIMARLSPENLSCDGELSRTQVKARYAALKRQWKELEKQVGRKVTEDEVETWSVANMRAMWEAQKAARSA